MFDISLSYFLLHFYPFFPILEYLVPITCLLHPPPNDFISIFDHVPKLSPPPHFPPMEAMVELVSSPYYAVRFVLWAVGFFHRFLSIRGRYLLFETLGYLPSPQVGGKRTVLHSSGVKSDRPQIRELVPEHRGFTHIHPYQGSIIGAAGPQSRMQAWTYILLAYEEELHNVESVIYSFDTLLLDLLSGKHIPPSHAANPPVRANVLYLSTKYSLPISYRDRMLLGPAVLKAESNS
ncbi:uncharacterized protein LOC122275700 isoform X3 [Carya illinoinensis]|uniref:uncharacterized protein LOC122275700 isoform X3 n=1 Tax=Carya illinoinensis TaxID=32201 RepID=UPI001C71AF74|nr:uncharacterized protein LOC122275700 isoform X3 [Carya illinoinensis]